MSQSPPSHPTQTLAVLVCSHTIIIIAISGASCVDW